MKKISSVVLAVFCLISMVKAQDAEKSGVKFSYEAGAEVVSSYLWRGQYLGGLSFQPTASVGFETENTSFSIGAWGSVGASDWGFRKGLEENENGNPNTYFVPELDIIGSFSFFGVTVGFTHYYYFGGSKFFCWNKSGKWNEDALENNTSTTEIQLGYEFSNVLPENHNLYANWYTMVAGNDFSYTENGDIDKRNFSSYIELGYDYTFDEIGLTLGAQIGMVPWASDYYGTENFAVQNLQLKLDKEWEFDACSLNLFAQGNICPNGLNKDNAFIKASGDDKIEMQKLNGCIGIGIWF